MSTVKCKVAIATGDVEVLLTMNRKNFMEMPDILTCGRRYIYMVVEGRSPLCWSSGTVGHLSKERPWKTTQPHRHPSKIKEIAVAGTCPKHVKIARRLDGSC